jgi:hypothetical protein
MQFTIRVIIAFSIAFLGCVPAFADAFNDAVAPQLRDRINEPPIVADGTNVPATEVAPQRGQPSTEGAVPQPHNPSAGDAKIFPPLRESHPIAYKSAAPVRWFIRFPVTNFLFVKPTMLAMDTLGAAGRTAEKRGYTAGISLLGALGQLGTTGIVAGKKND